MAETVQEPGQRPSRAVWRWVFAFGLAAILLYKALHGVDWARVWLTVLAARWEYLAGSALITMVSYFLRALRWRILLNAGAGAPLPVSTVFRANMAGYLGNNVLPARAGEVIRSLIVSSQSGLSRAYVLTTALTERLMDAIALVLWRSVTLAQVDSKPAWMEGVARTMTVLAEGGALTLTVLPHAEGLVQRIIRRLPGPAALKEKLGRMAEQILLAIRAFHNVGRFAGFMLLTVVIWTADACTVMVAARGLSLHIPFSGAALLLTAMGLSSALPSTPGYVGIYQFVTVTVLAPFGIARDEALAYSLVTQALGYVVIAVLGTPGLYGSLAQMRTARV
jgi:uncharacterized protein (TIRG00374 family)